MHRPLIRATLPRPEGQPPPPRPGPDFTIRQPAGGRIDSVRASSAGASHSRATDPAWKHGRADARGHAAPEQWPSTDDVALATRHGHRAESVPSKAAVFSYQPPTSAVRHQLSAIRRQPCPVSPASTVSSSVSPTSGRFPGRSPRRRQAAGARLALTYPSERLEENVRELAAKLDNPLVLPCDVTSDEQIAELPAALDREFGGLDFLVHGAAFAPTRGARQSVRRDDARRVPGRARRERVFAHCACARRSAADGAPRRRQHPDADVSGQSARLHQLQRHGRRESRARSLGAISRRRSGPAEHSRERHLRRRRSRHWRHRASPGFRASCRCTAIARRCGATSIRAKWPTPRVFLLGPGSRAITGEVLMVDAGFHAVGM